MTTAPDVSDQTSALARLRAATGAVHQRLELRLDAVEQLADRTRRDALVHRYAALHLPADEALSSLLHEVDGLDYRARSRTPLLAHLAGPVEHPAFPSPGSRAEALGMLYVLEGSTLGGRLILRELARRGVEDARLAFLDPYGGETGRLWRGFLQVLEREAVHYLSLAQAEAGAMRGFEHAEHVLCGGTS